MNKLQRMIDESRYVVFFGGAGVSTESGIKDFRSSDGLYSEMRETPPEVILSHAYFTSHTEEFYRYYKDKLLCEGILPNEAHKKLRELELAGKLKAVITQNIDGLHQAAGSREVIELHGSVHRNFCTVCHKVYDAAFVAAQDGVPRCSCGGLIKPDVVLYDEELSEEAVSRAVSHIARADLLIVAGTSLMVYPAAGLLRYFHGKYLALINRDETPLDRLANFVSHDKVGEVLGRVAVTARIESGDMALEISSHGAEAQHVIVDGKEQLWQDGGRGLWEGHSPVLFPIGSSLKDDRYFYDGQWYAMERHGFAKNSLFRLEHLSEHQAVFCLTDTKETQKHYPFSFEFRVDYRLEGRSLVISYCVKNTGKQTLPVSFGSHEAYACDGIEDYELVFDKDEFLDVAVFDGSLITGETKRRMLKNGALPLEKNAFRPEFLMSKNHRSRSLLLRKRDNSRRIRIDFPGMDYLVLWHVSGGEYICIEPWCSYIDRTDSDGDITKREGILLVEPHETVTKTHTITFEAV